MANTNCFVKAKFVANLRELVTVVVKKDRSINSSYEILDLSLDQNVFQMHMELSRC